MRVRGEGKMKDNVVGYQTIAYMILLHKSCRHKTPRTHARGESTRQGSYEI